MYAAAAVLACCITVVPSPRPFFAGSNAVAYARWNGSDAFIVESVVRGDIQVGDKLAYEPRSQCDSLTNATLYLVSRDCRRGGCSVAHANERDAPRLLPYLDRMHRETHETILATALRWTAGKMSAHEFEEWLGTIAVEPRDPDEDEFALELASDLENLAGWMTEVPKGKTVDMRAFDRLALDFPPGPLQEFDKKLEAAGDEESMQREDFDADLLDAIRNASEAALKLVPPR